MNWELLIILAIVVVAGAYVARRFLPKKGKGCGCGCGCDCGCSESRRRRTE